MRKFSALILSAVLLFTCALSVSADSAGLFKGMNLLPELSEKADSDLVRRDEFAAVAGVLSGFQMQAPAATAFSDVDETNSYSGMIRMLHEAKIISGVSETEYAPADILTLKQAISVYVKLLGFEMIAENKGGYPAGYITVAHALGAFDKISASVESYLTFGQLWDLTDWALETDVASFVYGQENGVLTEMIDLSEDSETMLESKLGLTMYRATVDSVSFKDYSINVTITKKTKDKKYTLDDTAAFTAPATINIAAYDKAPVKVWVNDEDELLYIAMDEDCEVRYGVVYSVNGDERTDAKYQISAVEELTFWDDDTDYEVAEDGLRVYVNDKKCIGSEALAGRFVRAVIEDETVLSLESWDFKEGGIVKEINFKNITYMRGSVTEQIKDTENFEKQILILDGEMRDIKDLKNDTLIDYYISDDENTLVILGTERKITDVFHSLGNGEMQIGNMLLLTNEAVYTSQDGTTFSEDSVGTLLGSDVTAYMDAYGRVRYIKPAGAYEKNEFVGYLVGRRQEGQWGDVELLVANLEEETPTQAVYTAADKIRFEDEAGNALTADDVYSTAKDPDGNAAYFFTKNADGEITKIKKLAAYYGFDSDGDNIAEASLISVLDTSPPYITVDGKRLFVETKQRVVGMYEEDGQLKFATSTWNSVKGTTSTNAKVRFYGKKMSSDFDLILLTGNISSMKGTSRIYGLVEKVTTCILPDGEVGKKIKICGKGEYLMTEEQATGIQANTFIYGSIGIRFGESELIVIEKLTLPDDLNSWAGIRGANIAFKSGLVEKIDAKRLYLEGGEAVFMDPDGCNFIEYVQKSKLNLSSVEEPLSGKNVVYVVLNGTSENVAKAVFFAE